MENALSFNTYKYWFKSNFNYMVTILQLLIEKLKMFPNIGIFLIWVVLFLVLAWFAYYHYNKVKLSYFLVLLILISISTAIYFNFSFENNKNEKIVLLIVWYLGSFSLFCYKQQKVLSFFLLYCAIYLFYFYCLYNDYINISSILLSYLFYLSVFFLYHCYFTFTQRFILRSYSIVKVFLSSYSLLKLLLWVFFVLFPTLVNNLFIFFLIFNQLLLLAFLSNHTTILFFLTLLWLWFSFLSISNYFDLFPKLRQEIVKYFSRRACLHFIGNSAGSSLKAHLPAIFIAIVTTIPAIAGPINEAATNANKAGQAALDLYKIDNPDVSPKESQEIYDRAFFKDLNNNKFATMINNITKNWVCKPRLVDGNQIHYTDKYSVSEAQRKLPKLNSDNSDAKNLSDLQQQYIEYLNSLRKSIANDSEDVIKEKLMSVGLKDDDASVIDAKEKLLEKLQEDANKSINSYYQEQGVERTEEIIYNKSDQSFCSQSIDSDSNISSDQSLSDEDKATGFDVITKERAKKLVEDAATGPDVITKEKAKKLVEDAPGSIR